VSTLSADDVRRALATVIDPEIRLPITELDMVEDVSVDDSGITATIALTIVGCPASDRIQRDCEEAIRAISGDTMVTVELTVMDLQRRAALTARLRGSRPSGHPFTADSLTRVIAITSGKGGVGKSTVTANLAVDAAQAGLRVGIIDADVFGFSIPGLMGIPDATPTRVDDMILPPLAHDVKVMSIGMFVSSGEAVSWRGPMLHRTVNQFLTDVYFGDLDLLLLDMPPGTGDVAISVGQLLPHADVIVVTTPQKGAADVAVRSAVVARQTGQRVIGVVEMMSPGALPDGTPLELFGSGGGEAVAASLEVPLLGQVPLSVILRHCGDEGTPVVTADPDDPAASAIRGIGESVRALRRSRVGSSLPVSPA
jgi:ATP-binding protein involved in chromosome partitioning